MAVNHYQLKIYEDTAKLGNFFHLTFSISFVKSCEVVDMSWKYNYFIYLANKTIDGITG